MVLRGSRHWWLVSGVTNVSSRTNAAFLNPASTSPYDQELAGSSGTWPIGIRPSLASAKSASVHFSSLTSIGGGAAGRSPGFGGGAGGRYHVLPPTLGFGPPGRSVSRGSIANGSGSKSILIFSIASAAVNSSTAATARIGSP